MIKSCHCSNCSGHEQAWSFTSILPALFLRRNVVGQQSADASCGISPATDVGNVALPSCYSLMSFDL